MRDNHLRQKIRQDALYLLFTGPAMLLFTTFVVCSVVLGIYYSLRDWNGISPESNFVATKLYKSVQ